MNIYIHKNDQQLGPFDDAQIFEGLKSGELSLDDLAWKEGQAEWVPLRFLWQNPQPFPPVPKNISEGKQIAANKSGIILKLAIGCVVLLGALLTASVIGVYPFTTHKTNSENQLQEIKGEVFITTKGADTKRLSGILIRFYQREKLQIYFDHFVPEVAQEANPCPQVINKIQTTIDYLADFFKKNSGHFTMRMIDEHHEKIKREYSLKKKYEILRDAWPHASYYFELLPQAEFETRSDSEGKFEIELPKGDWIIVSEACRKLVEDEDEWYYWTIPVNKTGRNMLSNHNLVTSGNPDSRAV
jgi:hypothetical protein